MIKNFVLDTNVLLHDPTALFKFRDNRIIIPITVIEELDRFKKDLNMLRITSYNVCYTKLLRYGMIYGNLAPHVVASTRSCV